MPFKTALDAAIASLVASGKIKSDADVARDLGYGSRGTISNYANGVTALSKPFKTKFENYYKISLDDFEPKNEDQKGNSGSTTTSNLKGDSKLIDTILDLTYTSRKNADGIDKMADANLINARSIETLVALLAANLGLANLKGVSLEDLQKGDVPAEAFLGGQPLPAPPKSKHGTGKKATTSN